MATRSSKKPIRWTEFECPECTAHNPWDDGFGIGDEVFCSWCGCRLVVKRANEEGDAYKLILD